MTYDKASNLFGNPYIVVVPNLSLEGQLAPCIGKLGMRRERHCKQKKDLLNDLLKESK